VGRPIGQGVDKEEFKRGLAYELSHDEAWWEGGRFEDLLVRKLFALLRNKDFALSYSSSAQTVTGVEPVSISTQSTIDRSMNPKKIFFVYSREDEILRNKLESQLSPMYREGKIENWHDQRILPGQTWEKEIERNLDLADIVLLLISDNFISSDYCYEVEMKKAVKLHEEGKAITIPIILSSVDWEKVPTGGQKILTLGSLQALPKSGKAITEWDNENKALFDIVKGIRTVVENPTQNPF
jgi:TIR domain